MCRRDIPRPAPRAVGVMEEENEEDDDLALAPEAAEDEEGTRLEQLLEQGAVENHGIEVPVLEIQEGVDHEAILAGWQAVLDYIHSDRAELPLFWHEIMREELWHVSAVEYLMNVAQSSSRSVVLLEPVRVENQAAARRTMQLVRSFPDLESLELKDPDFGLRAGEVPDAEYTERVNWILNAFRELQMAPGAPPSNLSKFDFACDVPVSASSMIGFLESVSSSLTELNYGEYSGVPMYLDEDLAGRLSGVFGRLPHLGELHVCLPISRFIPVVIDGLCSAAELHTFSLELNEGSQAEPTPAERQEFMRSTFKHVASLASRSKSLRALEVYNKAARQIGMRFNASSILVQAPASTSLESLALYGICVRCPRSAALGDASWNESLKSITFEECKLGVGTFELLSRFKGIKSIEFSGCIGLPRAGKCHWLLSKLPCLKSFALNRGEEGPAVPRDSILNSIVRAGRCFDLLKLSVNETFEDYHDRSLPSLEKLILTTAGSLDLSLDSNASDEFLTAGVRGTTTLQSLRLWHSDMTPSACVELFKAVQVNTSLRSFDFDFHLFYREVDRLAVAACCDSLTDLLRFNKGLRSIRLNFHFGRGNPEAPLTLVTAVVAGLNTNESIEAIEWGFECRYTFVLSTECVHAMLNVLKFQNTVLKRISGIDYMDYGSEDVSYYLWMNRSGRHFVKNDELVTTGLLPHILSAIGNDTGLNGIRYFLCNLPRERLAGLISSRGIRRSRPSSFEK